MNHRPINILIVAVLFAILIPKAVSASTIAMPTNYLTANSGLVGWWTFDGTRMIPKVIDSSGLGNSGNLKGQTATTTVLGQRGQALYFDGINDYVDAGSNSSLQLTSAGSIAVWVKYSAQPDFAVIAGNMDYFDDVNGYALVICKVGCVTSADGALILELGTAATHVSLITDLGYSDNQWHYVVATWNGNGANSGNIYIDSALVKTGTMTNSAVTGTNLGLGGEIFNGIFYYRGSMDDARIYNRALSAAEVTNLYGTNLAKRDKSVATNALATGLIGWWTFDGKKMLQNVEDSSGLGNNGYLTGFTSTTTTIGEIGQALSFDGSTSYVNIPDTNNSLDVTGAMTVSAWVYPLDLLNTPGVWHGMVGKGTNFYLGYKDRDFYITFNDGSWHNYGSPGSNNVVQWYHIVGVVDDDNDNVRLYINGNEVVNTSTAFNLVANNTAVTIGQIISQYTNGIIDDVRVYSRALTAAEVLQLYNTTSKTSMGTSLIGAPTLNTGLVGRWTFDGPDINWRTNTIYDKSVSGDNGTTTGMGTTTAVVPGVSGQALSFAGRPSYVDIGIKSALNLTTTGTVSAWFKVDPANASLDGSIAGNGDLFNDRNGYGILFCGASCGAGRLYFELSDGSGGVQMAPTTNYADGKWHFVVLTWDGTNERAYVDNVLKGGPSAQRTPVSNVFPFYIGKHPSVAGFSANLLGSVDDVRVYNRGLSATEVAQLYNLGR